LFWSLLSEKQTIFLSTFDPGEMLTFLMVYKDETLSALGKAVEECWMAVLGFWELPNEWPGSQPRLAFILEPTAGICSTFPFAVPS
jgi:hypothetical protein